MSQLQKTESWHLDGLAHFTSHENGDKLWNKILDQNEQIIWQGAPFHSNRKKQILFLFGVVSALLSLVLVGVISTEIQGFEREAAGVFLLLNLLVLAYSCGSLFHIGQQSNFFYTLTNKRAFVAEDIPGRKPRLRAFSIDASTRIEITTGLIPTIIFAEELVKDSEGFEILKTVGFENLPNGDDVFNLMLSVRENRP